MKNKFKMLTAASFFSVIFVSTSFGANVKIVNNTNDRIQVFFRGQGSTNHHVVSVAANGTEAYQINPEHIDNKAVFEAVASTGNGGSPNSKLLGGTCKNLVEDKDYTLLIEKTLGGIKTSCKAMEK